MCPSDLTSADPSLGAARSVLSATGGVVCLGADGAVVRDSAACSRLSVDPDAVAGRAPGPPAGLLVAASEATPDGGQTCIGEALVVAGRTSVLSATTHCVSATVDAHGRVQVVPPSGASLGTADLSAVDAGS